MLDCSGDEVRCAADKDSADLTGGAPQGGLLSVSRQEWEQIEDVPQHTRAVGIMFQDAARALQARAPPPSPERRRFDEAAYWSLAGKGPPAPPPPKDERKKPRAATKGASIQGKTAQAILEKDRQKAMDGSKHAEPPRKDLFSTRQESFTFAWLLWLRRQSFSMQTALAPKFLAWLHQTFLAAPASLVEELQAMAEGDGHLALLVLEELCASEAPLSLTLGLAELRLHEEQARLVAELRAAITSEAPLLLRYKTPPSGGKSSAAALVGAAFSDLKDVFVIYACYSRPVRVDVCKHLIAACVPFAICVQGIASPSFNCYHSGKGRKPHAPPPPDLASRVAYSLRILGACDRRPVVLVCDLCSTILFLQHRSRDVLLFDEPTADVPGSLLQDVRAILRLCPCRTVLMSATIPSFEQLENFVRHFEARHARGTPVRLYDLQANRLPMSVTALSPDGRVLAPHDFGATPQDLRQDGHLLRFYSPRVLRAMEPRPEELTVADLRGYEEIRRACLRLLESRSAPLASPPRHPALTLSQCCTSHAQLLPGTSLIVSDDQRVVQRSLATNLEGLPSLRRLLRARRSRAAPRPEKTKSELQEAQEGWLEAEEGALDRKYVVNSKAHLARFDAIVAFPPKLYRQPLYLPDGVLETSCEEHVEAALCGVLYLGSGGAVDAAYEATAQTLAERTLESFVVGGRALIYGLNLPFDRLVVDCEGLSRAELTQLCGRVGRACKGSTSAEIVFLSKKVARLALTAETGDVEGPAAYIFGIK